MFGVLGAVVFGWGMCFERIISSKAWKKRDIEAWNMFAYPLIGWFVVDTSWSLYSDFYPNALLNLAFLIGLGGPLLACRSTFSKKNEKSE